MTTSTTDSYRAIPPLNSEDNYPDIHEAGVGGGDPDHLYPTREWALFEVLASRWTYFLLGCASLLPWNALANGMPFFLSRLADSPFYTTFTSSLSSVFTLTKLFCLSYCTITSKQSSPSRHIFVSLFTTILLIVSLCLSTFVRGTPSTFFSFGLFSAASLAVTNSYLYAAVYVLAALLGPAFMQSVLSGQAAIAVVISVVQVAGAMIFLWELPSNPAASVVRRPDGIDSDAEEVAARILLGVSSLFLGMILAAYTWLTRQTFYKLAISAAKRRGDVGDADELAGLIATDHTRVLAYETSRVYRIFKQNWIVMVSIAYVFAVTLAIFPAITVRVRPVNQDIPPVLFTAVHFLVFNTGDLVGRLGHARPFPRSYSLWSAKNIFAMSLLRTLFIPLILLCNVYQPGPTVPPIINSDTLFMVILFMLGYTNGFVACIAMLAVSSPCYSHRTNVDVDVAAALGGTFQILGLASGALASFGVEAMI